MTGIRKVLWRISLLTIMCPIALPVSSQNNGLTNPVVTRPLYGEDLDGKIIEIPLPPTEVKGTTFVYDNWRMGSVELITNQKISDQWLRYDLLNEQMEIKLDGEVKVLKGNRIRKGQWLDPESDRNVLFVNNTNYKYKGTKLVGLLEVLVDGSLGLITKTSIKLIESNYLPQLNAGNRDDRLKKEKSYFVRKGNELFEVEKGRKKNEYLFEGLREEMMSYIKDERLVYSTEEDLIKIISRYNQLAQDKP